jgi:hypothetical protein
VLAIASIGAVVIAAALPETILAGDAANYRTRMVELFWGRVPYWEFPFEHQPIMIIPLALAWLLGGFKSQPVYVILVAVVSFLCLAVVTRLLLATERRLEAEGWAARWLLAVLPLLPFLLFRNDAFSILLTVASLVLAMRGREVASGLTAAAGVLAKIWSVVLAPVQWWRGKRAVASLLLLASAAAVAINFSPAVQSIQETRGLHTETIAGSIFGLWRSLGHFDLRIVHTATAYIDAPTWALALNGVAGLAIVITAVRSARGAFTWSRGWTLAGAFTVAGVMASPFFSPQYVSWFAPFAAQHRRTTWSMFAISLLSLVLVLGWFELFEGSVWWWGLLIVRNALAILLGLQLATAVAADSPNRGLRRAVRRVDVPLH